MLSLCHRVSRLVAPGVWSLRPGTLSGELHQLEPQSWGRVLRGGDVTADDAEWPRWLQHGRSGSSLLPRTWQGRAAWEDPSLCVGPAGNVFCSPDVGCTTALPCACGPDCTGSPRVSEMGGAGPPTWRGTRGAERAMLALRGPHRQRKQRSAGVCGGHGNGTAREGPGPGTRPLAGRTPTRRQAAAAAGPVPRRQDDAELVDRRLSGQRRL